MTQVVVNIHEVLVSSIARKLLQDLAEGEGRHIALEIVYWAARFMTRVA